MSRSAEPSAAAAREPDDLPPAWESMWRLVKLGYANEPRLIVVAFVLSLLSALPDALIALWLALLGKGVIDHNRPLVVAGALGMGLSAMLTWFLRTVSTRLQRKFRDKVSIALERHVAQLQASVVTVAHQERPDYLDRLAVLRDQTFVLDHMYMSMFSTCGFILRLAITVVMLMSIHPALVLLVLCALPTVWTSSWRPAVERQARERGAQSDRLARHLFVATTTAAPAKELRVLGVSDQMAARRRAEWEHWYALTASARWVSAVWHTLAWAAFGLGYVAAVVFVAEGLHASAGSVLLVLAAGARLSGYIGATVGEIGFLRGVWLDGSRRLAWLEDYADAQSGGDLPAPERLTDAIRIERLSFAYPGSSRLVLEDVDLMLPAGAVVAVVGENGAGKSTLVKLLAQMYAPTAGRIFVDSVPLERIAPQEWREKVAGAFQDFYRFELAAQQSVGVGTFPASTIPVRR